jgi:hypothetical protein
LNLKYRGTPDMSGPVFCLCGRVGGGFESISTSSM